MRQSVTRVAVWSRLFRSYAGRHPLSPMHPKHPPSSALLLYVSGPNRNMLSFSSGCRIAHEMGPEGGLRLRATAVGTSERPPSLSQASALRGQRRPSAPTPGQALRPPHTPVLGSAQSRRPAPRGPDRTIATRCLVPRLRRSSKIKRPLLPAWRETLSGEEVNTRRPGWPQPISSPGDTYGWLNHQGR